MKRIIILCLSIFFATNSMAFEGSVSFDMENGTKSINKTPTLYNFSKQLLLASENCSPYTENFTELNPELGKLGAMFGGELSVQIDIKGKQEEKCVFEVIMQLGLLGQQIQHCQISDDQRERLLIAMKDRSNEVITETFDSYIITKDANENIIDKQTYKTTMTDNRFNIEWAKIVQECDITQKELSEEDKAEQQKDFNTFDDKFLESLRLCQNDITSRQVLFLSEDIEIKGLKDGKCIIEYKDFIIHLPQEKLESIQSWENISELIKDKAISEYNYEQNYDYSNLLFAIDSCIKQDGSNGETIQSNEELKIIKSLEYKKITDGCEIAFVNILNRGSEEENYTKICKLPESYIQDIKKEHSTLIEQYGAKSGIDEKGHFYFQSAKSNEETKNADEKIWLEIRENNFCNLLNNHIKAHSLSQWEGEWVIGRYYNYSGGNLTIRNCQQDVCDFDVKTYNGAHTCDIEGKMKINGKTAQYHESMKILEDENAQETTVNFQLDEQKNVITVKCEGECRYYCGMQGYFEGEYENANNPLRYETSFDCWKKDLSDAEKTICATESIAIADIEMYKKYEKSITPEWKQKRNDCKKDVDCLWNFYVKSIKNEYEKINQKTLNLYEYLRDLEEDELYYPTEFTLLNDYFLNNMEKEDYEEWKLAFNKISVEDNECDNCYFHKYGVAGLFTIVESAFYINHDEIWISFLHADYEHKEDEYIIIYAPKNKTINDIPLQFNKWLERLKPHYLNGIKLKHFSS